MRENTKNYLGNLMFSGIAKGDFFRVLVTTKGKTPSENCNWYEFYKVVALSEESGVDGFVPVVHLLPVCSAVKVTQRVDDGQYVLGQQKMLTKLAGTRFVTGYFNNHGTMIVNGDEAQPFDPNKDSACMYFKVRERSSALRHAKDGGYIIWETNSPLI